MRDGLLRPAPIRPGTPPLWLGAAAPASRARAIRFDAGLIIAPLIELDHAARQFADYDLNVKAAGKSALPHALMREILIGDSVTEAIDAHKHALDLVYRQQYAPARTGLTRKDPETGERKPLSLDDPYYLSEDFMQARWFVGAPEQIGAKINRWHQRIGLQHLIWQPKPPGLDLKTAVRNLERMAGEIMPHLKGREATNG